MTFLSFPTVAPANAAPSRSWYLYTLLGAAFLVAGAFVLGDLAVATVISAILIAWTILLAGAVQIIHAFSQRGWKGFALDLLLGALYVGAGVLLLNNPVATSVVVTIGLGVILIISGIFRLFLGSLVWSEGGWVICFSGIIGTIAGVYVLSHSSGLWLLGLVFGIDLVMQGAGWIAYSFNARSNATSGVA